MQRMYRCQYAWGHRLLEPERRRWVTLAQGPLAFVKISPSRFAEVSWRELGLGWVWQAMPSDATPRPTAWNLIRYLKQPEGNQTRWRKAVGVPLSTCSNHTLETMPSENLQEKNNWLCE
ncbi:hypothetical protein NDU88_001412 [Pleurodeles waltl]|uniref:Uncharacterized protein n=1 Tax=Pleurodeles waltl TaxID=8319 RepID=A0AAV7KTD0_PLEWA|nr:hypothetical protein NDU88_001412 [Pleurodeles waltl]